MLHLDDTDLIDDAAVTLRYFALDAPTDPDATSIYDLGSTPAPPRYVGRDHSAARRRLVRATRQDIAGLRDALAAGWDVGPELAHEQRRLAGLEGALSKR